MYRIRERIKIQVWKRYRKHCPSDFGHLSCIRRLQVMHICNRFFNVLFFRSLVGNKLVTKKLTTKTNSLPRWAERVRAFFWHFAILMENSIRVQQQNSWQNYMTFIKMGFEGMIDHKGSIHNLAGVKVRTEKK